MTMTRAEGICACTNIIELAEELSEVLPDKYASDVSGKAADIRKTLRERKQFAHLTEGQDRALRNIWGGLRRWDHGNEANDDLFWGLQDVLDELADDAEAAEEASASTAKAPSMDEGMNLPEITPEAEARFAQRQAAYEARQARKEAPGGGEGDPEPPKPRKTPVQRVGAQVEDIARERENVITTALQRFHADGIRVVDSKVVQHGDILAILKKTTSDRTRQLIRAAYHAGTVRGAHNVSDELIKKVKR
jgi:hypothetical protein